MARLALVVLVDLPVDGSDFASMAASTCILRVRACCGTLGLDLGSTYRLIAECRSRNIVTFFNRDDKTHANRFPISRNVLALKYGKSLR